MSDCGCSKKADGKKDTGQIIVKKSGNPGSCLCGSTFWEGYGFIGAGNRYRQSYAFKPTEDITTSKIKFWLRKTNDYTKVPLSGTFYILDVDQSTGRPGATNGLTSLASNNFDVPVGLSLDGQEFEVSFSSVNLTAGHVYALCWEFLDCDYLCDPKTSCTVGTSVGITVQAGMNDTCDAGFSKEKWSSRYGGGQKCCCEASPTWANWIDDSSHAPYYCLGVKPLAVVTLPCTGAGKTYFTANGEVTYDGGYPITTRGFEYGPDVDGVEPEVWSEDGEFGVGEFSHKLEGLSPGTVYFFRAFACGEGIE